MIYPDAYQMHELAIAVDSRNNETTVVGQLTNALVVLYKQYASFFITTMKNMHCDSNLDA